VGENAERVCRSSHIKEIDEDLRSSIVVQAPDQETAEAVRAIDFAAPVDVIEDRLSIIGLILAPGLPALDFIGQEARRVQPRLGV